MSPHFATQLLTAEQWRWVGEASKWSVDHIIIPIAIWGYHRVKISLQAAKIEIIGQIASDVEKHTGARIAAHEASDERAFGVINQRLAAIEAAIRMLTPIDPVTFATINSRLDTIEGLLLGKQQHSVSA